jgi:hypothetical protein
LKIKIYALAKYISVAKLKYTTPGEKQVRIARRIVSPYNPGEADATRSTSL